MPELPEVETTCRGIRPHLLGKSEVDWAKKRSDVPNIYDLDLMGTLRFAYPTFSERV